MREGRGGEMRGEAEEIGPIIRTYTWNIVRKDTRSRFQVYEIKRAALSLSLSLSLSPVTR